MEKLLAQILLSTMELSSGFGLLGPLGAGRFDVDGVEGVEVL